MLLGLRTAIYPTSDLAATTAWFTSLLGDGPYFETPQYVGFEVGGYELGILPMDNPPSGTLTYWGVADADAAIARLVELGAVVTEPIADVGEGIRIGAVTAPTGAVVGVIENPNFSLPDKT